MTQVTLKAVDGEDVTFVKTDPMRGSLRDVYFTLDRQSVVAFYRAPIGNADFERLEKLAGFYRESVFNQEGGDYWRELFRWPERLVKDGSLLGLVVPAYQSRFFFGEDTNLSGADKEGKWFTSAKSLNRFVPVGDMGTLPGYLKICLNLSRPVRRLHAAGLAHSDLSDTSCLVDPVSGSACLIDIDRLAAPGLKAPNILGTRGFMAPEIVMAGYSKREPPCREADRHSLSVLIYSLLLHRHPLRGSAVYSGDKDVQESLQMGEKALFIENPKDARNRSKVGPDDKDFLPWIDAAAIPCAIMGPHLQELFEKAFIGGLRDPLLRPAADDWEVALVKTLDLLQPCQNPSCSMKWHVFANTRKPVCPYCGAPFHGQFPILDFYSTRDCQKYLDDKHRLMVYENQRVHLWHVDKMVFPNEKLSGASREPVGYFSFDRGRWFLVNQAIDDMMDVGQSKPIPRGKFVELKDGQSLLLKRGPGGRLARVTMVRA